jgi:hypothetical protein
VLFVTHDMGAVRRYCHRAMLLERGQMRLIGEPDRVGDHYVELNFGRDHFEGGVPEEAGERLGDQAARIVEVWFEDRAGERTEVLRHGEPCKLCARVNFNRPAEPNFAVLVEDEQHRPLFATSSADLERRVGPCVPGDEVVYAVSFDMLFSPGRLYVTPWLVHEGGSEVIDRQPRAHTVVVTGTRRTGAMVDVPHDIAVTTTQQTRHELPA